MNIHGSDDETYAELRFHLAVVQPKSTLFIESPTPCSVSRGRHVMGRDRLVTSEIPNDWRVTTDGDGVRTYVHVKYVQVYVGIERRAGEIQFCGLKRRSSADVGGRR